VLDHWVPLLRMPVLHVIEYQIHVDSDLNWDQQLCVHSSRLQGIATSQRNTSSSMWPSVLKSVVTFICCYVQHVKFVAFVLKPFLTCLDISTVRMWFLCTGFCTNFYLTLTENLYPVGLGDMYILASMKIGLETVSPWWVSYSLNKPPPPFSISLSLLPGDR